MNIPNKESGCPRDLQADLRLRVMSTCPYQVCGSRGLEYPDAQQDDRTRCSADITDNEGDIICTKLGPLVLLSFRLVLEPWHSQLQLENTRIDSGNEDTVEEVCPDSLPSTTEKITS